MSKEVLIALCFVGILCGFFLWHRVVQFWRWLKGSQTNYHLGNDGMMYTTVRELDKDQGAQWADPTIEARRGPFCWRVTVHGLPYPNLWKIVRNNDQIGGWVQLTDRFGLPVEKALRMINRYYSLRAVLDDLERTKTELDVVRGHNEEFRKRRVADEELIAKLDRELDEQRSLRRSLEYGVEEILAKIEEDRHRYRSKPSQNIRQRLEALRHIIAKYVNGHSETFPNTIGEWQDEFKAVLRSGVFKAH